MNALQCIRFFVPVQQRPSLLKVPQSGVNADGNLRVVRHRTATEFLRTTVDGGPLPRVETLPSPAADPTKIANGSVSAAAEPFSDSSVRLPQRVQRRRASTEAILRTPSSRFSSEAA